MFEVSSQLHSAYYNNSNPYIEDKKKKNNYTAQGHIKNSCINRCPIPSRCIANPIGQVQLKQDEKKERQADFYQLDMNVAHVYY